MGKSETAYGRAQEMYETSIDWRFVHPRMNEMGHTDPLGITAENVARQYDVSREDQDAFALQSQQRWEQGGIIRPYRIHEVAAVITAPLPGRDGVTVEIDRIGMTVGIRDANSALLAVHDVADRVAPRASMRSERSRVRQIRSRSIDSDVARSSRGCSALIVSTAELSVAARSSIIESSTDSAASPSDMLASRRLPTTAVWVPMDPSG